MKSFGCMPAVRTPEACRTLTVSCPGILPSPLRDKVGAFHHERFRGYVSVHSRSGLHPPCLRFAAAVAGHHARLGTRLLVRLCRGRHHRRLNSMRLQGATPHHRAYGSVPRRFGGLSTRQLFHGKQTQTTEASFGEGAMQRFREAQPPRSLWAEDSRTGRPFEDLEPTELAIALTARLPLDPDDATQAPSDPAIQRWQFAPLAEAEVPGPTPHERVQVGNHLLQADAPMPPRQFANPVFEPGHGLVGDAPPERRVILDGEAEERPVPRSGAGPLLGV